LSVRGTRNQYSKDNQNKFHGVARLEVRPPTTTLIEAEAWRYRGEYREAAGAVAPKVIRGPVPMSAFGGKTDIEAKLLTKDEARRIAAKYSETAGAVAIAPRKLFIFISLRGFRRDCWSQRRFAALVL
jgi:hypothetical protein